MSNIAFRLYKKQRVVWTEKAAFNNFIRWNLDANLANFWFDLWDLSRFDKVFVNCFRHLNVRYLFFWFVFLAIMVTFKAVWWRLSRWLPALFRLWFFLFLLGNRLWFCLCRHYRQYQLSLESLELFYNFDKPIKCPVVDVCTIVYKVVLMLPFL